MPDAQLPPHRTDSPQLSAPVAGDPRDPSAPLKAALRAAMAGRPGRVVLRIAAPPEPQRKALRTLLQEVALTTGGQVLDGVQQDLLLIGAEATRAERICALIARLVGPNRALVWSMDRDAEALITYASGGGLAEPQPALEGPALAELDAWLETVPLAGIIRRRQGLRMMPSAPAQPAFLRVEPARDLITAALEGLGSDPDLLDHASRRIARRIFEAMADPRERQDLIGEVPMPRLHLHVTTEFASQVCEAGMAPDTLVATIPVTELAEPARLAARIARFAEAAIAIEFDGLHAPALEVMELDALPAGLLRLHWSPALDADKPRAALGKVDPARLVLAGAVGAEALRFAASLGIALIEAPA